MGQKYLIIGKRGVNETLEWNACDTPEQAASFIKTHYKKVLENYNYDWMKVHSQILVIVVPEYHFATLNLVAPSEAIVEVFGRKGE